MGRLVDIKARLAHRAWTISYELAEAREGHVAHQRHLRAAACCLALAVLGGLGAA